MKRVIYSAVIVCLLATAVSCKSTKAGKKSSEEEAEAPALTEASAEEQPVAEESETDKKSKKEKKSKVKAAKEEPKDFTGWIKAPKKNIKEKYGRIQLKVKAKRGSYTLAVLNAKDQALPVLSAANEYVTNAFWLKTARKTYNLVTDTSINSSARRTEDGAMLLYDIPGLAQVTVNLSFLSSEPKKETDMVKVSAVIKNVSSRNDEFAFKSILDTVLGESSTYHFYTYDEVPVKSEVLYRTLQNQKWFVSKNVNASMQLFFTGADCTVPELVGLANYSTLDKNSWEPDMLSYRGFDTVLSYSNSAVCAIWKPVILAPDESTKITFYIALAADGNPATGEKYVFSKEYNEKAGEDDNSAKNLKFITEIEDGSEDKTASDDGSLVPTTPVISDDIPTVDFYLKKLTKEQLTPEYIQSLIDRIDELEKNSPSVNRQEILQLNAELDAILMYLRQ